MRSGFFRRILAIAVLVLAIPALSGFTFKGEKIDKRYYRIYGASHAELVKAVRRNAPRNGRAYGLGIIDFFPSYQTERKDGSCRVKKAEVGLRVQLRLPRWHGNKQVPRRVLRIARNFERVINAHEMQHVRIARRYTRLMKQRLLKMPAEKSCWTLRSNTRAMIRDLKKQHIWAHRRFDNRTRKQIRRLL
ncbi:MAG: DUF922 domain-containing protein [Rhizobiaceae bacterium]